LHRGATLKNTDEVLALVVYTGKESKIIANLGNYKFKQSATDTRTNYVLVFNTIILLTFSLLFSLLNYRFSTTNLEKFDYIFEGDFDPKVSAANSFFSFYLLMNLIIPLDMAVSMEFIKLVVTLFIESDAWMTVVDPTTGQIRGFKSNAVNLIDQIGEIEYLFCDKTGTLTQNKLIFKEMSKCATDENRKQFFRCLSLCHECTAIKLQNEEKVVFSGPSLDESCLLEMCYSTLNDKTGGYFIDKDSDKMRI